MHFYECHFSLECVLIHQLAIDNIVLPDMEAWISLLTLDSQTSSQVISEENLREIFKGLKKCDVLSKDSFSILVNALSEKATCFESRPIPPDFFNVLSCLCEHLTKCTDLLPEDVRSFFLSFVEVISRCIHAFYLCRQF